jgi:hypothetical protein
MDRHRCVAAANAQAVLTDAPFSCFDWIETRLAADEAIRRCFSLARSLGMRSFVAEEIPAEGIVAEENAEIRALAADHTMSGLLRLSFWKVPIPDMAAVGNAADSDLLGYAIFKHGSIPSRGYDRWHVFEAVFRKYPHEHNCVPFQREYAVRVGDRQLAIHGVLYAQQNGLNKACAHVAMRTLLSRLVPQADVSYCTLNKIARAAFTGSYVPANGLGVRQIREILRRFKVPFRDLDYTEEATTNPDIRASHPFQKFVYAGIESGCGALLGFRMTGPAAPDSKHIVPFFGHTFNKDTWVPDADSAYFNVGGGIGYIPSESWTSSFLGHDDNFGPNLCVPRLYVRPDQAEYVVELLHPGVAYSGVHAEAITLLFLYSLAPHLDTGGNPWLRRLKEAAHPSVQRVVLRAVCVTQKAYIAHLRGAEGWDRSGEVLKLVSMLKPLLPDRLWVVEVSLPHLFPANERKVGEILLNPHVPFKPQSPIDYKLFLLARLPGSWFLMRSHKGGSPDFVNVPSGLRSHVPLMKA